MTVEGRGTCKVCGAPIAKDRYGASWYHVGKQEKPFGHGAKALGVQK